MKIEISEEKLGILCICAIRYCHGRQTYMPGLVQGIVKQLLQKLSEKDINVMLEDCEFQKKMNLYGDDRIDKPGWLEWEKTIRNETERTGLEHV